MLVIYFAKNVKLLQNNCKVVVVVVRACSKVRSHVAVYAAFYTVVVK